MPKRISAADAHAPIRVVIVTMDSHLSGAVGARRGDCAARTVPGLELVDARRRRMGRRRRARWPRCHADIAAATSSSRPCCFWRTISARCCRRSRRGATHCDAMLCCMSAGEIMRLTRLGRFDMSQRGDRRARDAEAAARRKTRAARGLERPGADEDAAPPAEAAALHSRHRAGRAGLFPGAAILAGGIGGKPRQPGPHAGRPLRGAAAPRPPARVRAAPPVDYPDVGLYHPGAPGRIVERLEQLPAPAGLARHGRPAAAALLCAGGQRRAL